MPDFRVCPLIYRESLTITVPNIFPRFLRNGLGFVMTLRVLWDSNSHVTESGFNALVTKMASILLFSMFSNLGFWASWKWGLDRLSMMLGPLNPVRNSAPNSGSEVITSKVEFLQVRKFWILFSNNGLLPFVQFNLSLGMCPFSSNIDHVAGYISLPRGDVVLWHLVSLALII